MNIHVSREAHKATMSRAWKMAKLTPKLGDHKGRAIAEKLCGFCLGFCRMLGRERLWSFDFVPLIMQNCVSWALLCLNSV